MGRAYNAHRGHEKCIQNFGREASSEEAVCVDRKLA